MNIIIIITNLQSERFVRIELNQEHWSLVSPAHSKALVVQSSVVERADEIGDALSFDANVGREDVVADLIEDADECHFNQF